MFEKSGRSSVAAGEIEIEPDEDVDVAQEEEHAAEVALAVAAGGMPAGVSVEEARALAIGGNEVDGKEWTGVSTLKTNQHKVWGPTLEHTQE